MTTRDTTRWAPGTDPLRPRTLDEFHGQPELVAELRILLGSATARRQMPDHLLFVGPPGLGKTTLAHLVASELGVPLVVVHAPAVERPGDLAAVLAGMGGPSVVFIDEVHALDRAAEEVLYPAMEDGTLDLTTGTEDRVRTVRVPLHPFTLVAATTRVGSVSAPLRSRFGYVGQLQPYPTEVLAAIVTTNATRLGLRVDPEAATEVATRSRGTPRVANTLLRRVRDWAQVHGLETVTVTDAAAALDTFGVDRAGLDRTARRYLEILVRDHGGGPVGLSTLAAALDEDPGTLEVAVEPHLLRSGMVARTPRGRVATAAAWEHLGLEPPAREGTLFG